MSEVRECSWCNHLKQFSSKKRTMTICEDCRTVLTTDDRDSPAYHNLKNNLDRIDQTWQREKAESNSQCKNCNKPSYRNDLCGDCLKREDPLAFVPGNLTGRFENYFEFKKWQYNYDRRRVNCENCNKDLLRTSLSKHRQCCPGRQSNLH